MILRVPRDIKVAAHEHIFKGHGKTLGRMHEVVWRIYRNKLSRRKNR